MTQTQGKRSIDNTAREIASLVAQVANLQRLLTIANKREQWYKKIIAQDNKKLSAADKVVTFATYWESEEHPTQLDGTKNVYQPFVSERGGVSDDTTSKTWGKLEKIGAIKKTVTRDKKQRLHVSIGFTSEMMVSPETLLQDIEETNHGGDRIVKPCECGCGEFTRKTITKGTRRVVMACNACGEIQSDETTILDKVVNKDVKVGDDIQEELAGLDDYIQVMPEMDAADVSDAEYEAGARINAALNAAATHEQDATKQPTRSPHNVTNVTPDTHHYIKQPLHSISPDSEMATLETSEDDDVSEIFTKVNYQKAGW